MTLAVSCIAWQPEDEDLVARVLTNEGISNIEIVPGRVNLSSASAISKSSAEYKNYWSQKEISCVAMQALLFGTENLSIFGSEESKNAMLSHLSKVFAAGQILGVKRFVFGSPKNRIKGKIDSERAIQIAAGFFTLAGKEAAKYGGCLCLEANPAEYGGDFILNTAEAFDLVTEVNQEGFGLHLDTGGMLLAGEDIAAVTHQYCSQIKHFHVSAPNLMPIYDSADLDKIKSGIEVLEENNYQGFISLEMKGLGAEASQEERIEHVSRGASCLKKLFN